MQKVEEAVKFLKSTYGSLDSAAAMWNLDPVEVHEALAKATEGTSEHYVLRLLANNNPLPEVIKPKKQKKITDVVLTTNVVEEDANRAIE